jgi:hypothetical protein
MRWKRGKGERRGERAGKEKGQGREVNDGYFAAVDFRLRGLVALAVLGPVDLPPTCGGGTPTPSSAVTERIKILKVLTTARVEKSVSEGRRENGEEGERTFARNVNLAVRREAGEIGLRAFDDVVLEKEEKSAPMRRE